MAQRNGAQMDIWTQTHKYTQTNRQTDRQADGQTQYLHCNTAAVTLGLQYSQTVSNRSLGIPSPANSKPGVDKQLGLKPHFSVFRKLQKN